MFGDASMDLTDFRWLPGERLWMRPSVPGPRLEVTIAGDEAGPDPARLPVAEAVLAGLEAVTRAAVGYLDYFVHRPHFGCRGDWCLDGLAFGRGGDEPPNEFEAGFTVEDDPYGWWTVTMRHTPRGNVPFAFARRQG